MSLVLRSFFSYQVAVGSTMSEYRQVVLMRKSSVTSRSSLPSGALSCQTTSSGFASSAPEVLALHAVAGAEQVLQEVLVALARGADDVGAPDEHVARPVGRVVGVLAAQLQRAVLQRLAPHSPSARARQRRRRAPPAAGWSAAAAPRAASPCARRARCSRSGCRARAFGSASGDSTSSTPNFS